MKTKKVLSLLLLVAMTLSMFMPAYAATASGKLGDNVTWTYDSATKTIILSGYGPTYDYTLDKQTYDTDSPLEPYNYKKVKNFIVEEGITYLGKYIFYCGTEDCEIYIPKSVTKIEGEAFGTIFDFNNCNVYYAGTEDEWNDLDRDYDFYFEEAIMHYGAVSKNSAVATAPASTTPAVSNQNNTSVQTSSSKNDIKVYIDNKIVNFDVQPQLIASRTMVPLRAIFEALGATIQWDQKTQTVTAYPPTTPIVVATIGKYEMTVGKTVKEMDVPPVIINNRTLVPARFVAEALGCDVAWDAANRSVLITTKPGVIEPDTPSTPAPTPEPAPAPTPTSVPEEPEEPVKSGKPYKVETISKKIDDMAFISLVETGGPYVLHNNDLYYTLRDKGKIMKVNVQTGQTETYIDFSDPNYQVEYKGEKWNVDNCIAINYDVKRDTLVATDAQLSKENKLSGKTTTEFCYYLDLTKKREIELGTECSVFGTFENGDLLIKPHRSRSIKRVKYPTYKQEVREYYLGSDMHIGNCVTINGKLYYFTKKTIYADGHRLMDTYGNSVGGNSKNLFMMSDSSIFKLDEEGEIISTISLDDVEEADGKDIFNDKRPEIYVTENEDIIFFDCKEYVFRKISKN